METIRSFEDMVIHLAQRGERKRVAIVWAADQYSQESVIRALEVGFIDAIFVGCREEVENNKRIMRYQDHITFIDASDRDTAAKISVQMVREGKADILMKGLINTDNLLHVVLDKQTGMLPKGNVLTHITAARLPEYEKLLFFTDSAVIPYPTQEQRIQQIRYMVYVCHALGIEEPKISLIHCTEKVNEKYFPFTIGYKEIIRMAERGEFGKCIIDGEIKKEGSFLLQKSQY